MSGDTQILQPLPASRIKRMTQAAMTFHHSWDASAQEYLEARGIAKAHTEFGLGLVPGDCDPEWDYYKGWLSIPFWNPHRECVSIRFRNITGDDRPKYLQPSGSDITIYNLKALVSQASTIVITEGEFDAMTLGLLGIRAVGMPGANSWKPYYARLFDGFNEVIVWGDPDDAGRKFNAEVQSNIRRAVPAYMTEDINDTYRKDDGFATILTAYQKAGGKL